MIPFKLQFYCRLGTYDEGLRHTILETPLSDRTEDNDCDRYIFVAACYTAINQDKCTIQTKHKYTGPCPDYIKKQSKTFKNGRHMKFHKES